MTHPRMSVPSGTYTVTRTTAMRPFLLTPGPIANQIMEDCLAWAARGRGVLFHAVSVHARQRNYAEPSLFLADLSRTNWTPLPNFRQISRQRCSLQMGTLL